MVWSSLFERYFPRNYVCFLFEYPCPQVYIVVVMIRQLITEYLSFTQKERVAIIALMVLILIVYALPRFITSGAKAPAEKDVQEFRMLERKLAQSGNGRDDYSEEKDDRMMHAAVSKYDDSRPARLFYFDPNTLDEPGWERLGLRGKTIGTIQKYLSKGGHFYKPDDLKKIYGLRPAEYDRIAAYVRIDAGARDATEKNSSNKDASRRGREFENKNDNYNDKAGHGAGKRFVDKTPLTIDVNTADTSMFIALPGIGSKLAARIVLFREKLGGFCAIGQMSEVYGLPDSTFQKLRSRLTISTAAIRKIDINTATLELLKQHPYIRWNIAKAIVAYREQHGAFKNLEELQQIEAVSAEAYKKMLPYIAAGN